MNEEKKLSLLYLWNEINFIDFIVRMPAAVKFLISKSFDGKQNAIAMSLKQGTGSATQSEL